MPLQTTNSLGWDSAGMWPEKWCCPFSHLWFALVIKLLAARFRQLMLIKCKHARPAAVDRTSLKGQEVMAWPWEEILGGKCKNPREAERTPYFKCSFHKKLNLTLQAILFVLNYVLFIYIYCNLPQAFEEGQAGI